MSLHNELKHPNIIEMIKCFEDEKKIYMVLEYSPNGVGAVANRRPSASCWKRGTSWKSWRPATTSSK